MLVLGLGFLLHLELVLCTKCTNHHIYKVEKRPWSQAISSGSTYDNRLVLHTGSLGFEPELHFFLLYCIVYCHACSLIMTFRLVSSALSKLYYSTQVLAINYIIRTQLKPIVQYTRISRGILMSRETKYPHCSCMFFSTRQRDLYYLSPSQIPYK